MQRSLLPALLLAALSACPALAQDASFERFGSGCAGSAGVPSLDAAEGNLPRIGETFRAEFSNLPSSASPFGLIGLVGLSNSEWAGVPLPFDLSPLGVTGCSLYVSVLRANPLLVNGDGSAGWTLHVDNEPSLIGVHFFAQGLVLDPSANAAGYVVTNAGEGVIGANAGPEATIIFPTKVSATDARSIIVRGTASDPSGVAEVRVNGRLAASGDGFANWQVEVPLERGVTALVVSTRDGLGVGDGDAARASIESQAIMTAPVAIALDLDRNRALVINHSTLFEIDVTSGNREVLSGQGRGDGPKLGFTSAIALDYPRNRALLVEPYGRLIHAVDLDTGDRSVFARDGLGATPGLGNITSIAVDEEFAYVVSSEGGSSSRGGKLVSINLLTGDRALVSSSHSTGQGAIWSNPIGVEVDGARAIVRDGTFATKYGHFISGSYLSVDLVTGERSNLPGFGPVRDSVTDFGEKFAVLGSVGLAIGADHKEIIGLDLIIGQSATFSGSQRGSGPSLEDATAIAVAGSLAVVVDGGSRAIIAIDLPTGDRRYLSRVGVGTGPKIWTPSEVVFDGEQLLAMDSGTLSIVAIDLATGGRQFVSNEGNGVGPSFPAEPYGRTPAGITLRGDQLLVARNSDLKSLMAVDLQTGDRRIVTGEARGVGTAITGFWDVVFSDDRALVTAVGVEELIAVDLTTGDREIYSGPGVGAGPPMLPFTILMDGQQAIIVDVRAVAILAVDSQSRDRSIISSGDRGSGPLFTGTTHIAKFGEQIVLAFDGTIIGVDLETGDRRLLSGNRGEMYGNTLGSGPIADASGITVLGSIAFVSDTKHGAIMVVDLLTGDRVIMSQ